MYKQFDLGQKLIQLDNTADIFIRMLRRESFIAYNKGIRFDNMDDLILYINTEIDVRPYLNIEYSKNFSCIRRSCINIHSANFYKGVNNITMYHCNDCGVKKNTTTLYRVIVEVIGAQLGTFDVSTITSYIRSLFDVCYVSEFYANLSSMTQNNVKMLRLVGKRTKLSQLLRGRKLIDFYSEFAELATIYMREDEPLKYAFYLSQSQIKKQYEYKLNKKASNYTVAKVNMLVALNLIEKVDEDKVITYTDYVGTLMSSVTDIINVISYVLIAFVAISLVVSSIMIGVITYISVLERKKEIGILRAIGASKRNISQVFNAETFIIGLFAGVLGIVITLLLLIPGNMIIHDIAGSQDVSAILPVTGAVVLIILSVVLTLIGGLIPAKKAALEDPVTALRTE